MYVLRAVVHREAATGVFHAYFAGHPGTEVKARTLDELEQGLGERAAELTRNGAGDGGAPSIEVVSVF